MKIKLTRKLFGRLLQIEIFKVESHPGTDRWSGHLRTEKKKKQFLPFKTEMERDRKRDGCLDRKRDGCLDRKKREREHLRE